MSFIETHELKNSTVMLMYSERDEIQTDPDYQRMGGVWTLEKRRLLIDSIINDYDLPKLYFHQFSQEKFSETGNKYAIIDGRQRLETIWQFMDDGFSLTDDLSVHRDPSINLKGLRYSDLAKEHPKLRIKFDSFVLPIIAVRTIDDEIDLIEDMFSRLNEAVPLNAAEKRNALGGEFVRAINQVSTSTFFTKNVKFSNSRYQYREVSARLLLTEYNVSQHKRLIDTKKVYLDQISRDLRDDAEGKVAETKKAVSRVLRVMSEVFVPKDELLAAQGMMVVYYLLFRKAISNDLVDQITRSKLIQFREDSKENRRLAEEDYASSKFELLEFERLNQQGTNDASSIAARYRILATYLGVIEKSEA